MLETLTRYGHIIGMLDRDQRTAKLINFNKIFVIKQWSYFSSNTQTVWNRSQTVSHIPRRTSPHSSCRTRKYGHFWKSLLRLKHALIVGIYFSLICTLPNTLSAPTNRKAMSTRMNEHPKWINPCGISADNGPVHDSNTDIRQVSDEELLARIVDQANIAYSKAKQFKEDFVQKTFNMNFEQLHNNWKDNHYEWLPSLHQIPKQLGETVPQQHLDGLKLETALLDTYEYLQKIAVGLEQIVWDQQDEHAAFEASFKEAEHNLRNVLCELQMAIYEKDIKMRPDIKRDIMTDEFRIMDNTSTNLRNWLIYRDYMNILEYTMDSFKSLKKKL